MTRPFKGINMALGPAGSYDVVVIGAGVAGLINANLLARAGKRVLLVEQHYMVGGYCSTFRRRGYTFDAASHFYPLLGNPETITGKLLVDLGIDCGWVKMDPVDHFHFPDGSHFRVPASLEAYRQLLDAQFPEERAGLEAFFDEVNRAYLAGLLLYFRGVASRQARQWQHRTLRDALDQHFADPKLKLILTADGPHWGAPPSRTSFLFDSMLRLSYFLGNYYPQGGSQNFADALAARFEQLGGHIATKTRVKRIQVAGERVQGVILQCGRSGHERQFQVMAANVVSAGDMLHCLDQLIDPIHLDATYLDHLRGMRPTYPCYLMHLGLRDTSAEELAKIQGYYWNAWDPDRMGIDSLRFKLFVPTLFEPKMAPPGGQVLIVQKVLEMDFEKVDDWDRHKQEIDAFVWAGLRELLPDVERRVVTWSSASARTSQRFTGNFQGAMLGWEMSPEQLAEGRPDTVIPIQGLYFTGHWTRPGGGITPVIVSAMRVAKEMNHSRAEALSASA